MPIAHNTLKNSYKLLYLLLTAALLVYLALCLVRPALMMSGPSLTAYNEGWNAGFAQRLMQGLPLYPAPHELITNNYPPLSFIFYALIGHTGVDLIYTGRIISFFAYFASAWLVFKNARAMGCDFYAAAFGALLLLLTIARFFPYYVGMNEPQWLAHSVMLLGLLVFITSSNRKTLLLSGLIMLAGGLIKHNLLALPLACTLWLFIYQRRDFLFFLLSGAALAALSIAAMHFIFGPDIWFNLFNARAMYLDKLLRKGEYMLAVCVPLLVWFGVIATQKTFAKNKFFQLISYFMLFAFAEVLAFGAGDGVAANIVFDLVIACCLAMACAFHVFRQVEKPAYAPLLLMFLAFLQIAAWPNYRYIAPAFSAKARQYFTGIQSSVRITINTLKNVNGNAWCEQPNICYWSGKPFTFDSYNVKQRLMLGRLSQKEIDAEFERLKVTALLFDMRNVKADNPSSAGEESVLVPLLPNASHNVTDANGYGSVMTR